MIRVVLLIFTALSAYGADYILPVVADETTENQATLKTTVDIKLIASYFDKLAAKGMIYTQPRPEEIDFAIAVGNIVLPSCVNVDEKAKTVYIATIVGRIPPDHEHAGNALTTLMKQNFAINWGKIEWDKVKGDVRISYTFLADDGLPYDEFTFILDQIQRSAEIVVDEINQELNR